MVLSQQAISTVFKASKRIKYISGFEKSLCDNIETVKRLWDY